MRASHSAVLLPLVITAVLFVGCKASDQSPTTSTRTDAGTSEQGSDAELVALLNKHNFTGRVEETLTKRLGRPINEPLAEVGRLLFFDRVLSIHSDTETKGTTGNPCSGCHAPNAAMADTQSIAVGVDPLGVVGKSRKGPRNQRRSPTVINTAFYPKLMWEAKFLSNSGDPFDNSQGFDLQLEKFEPNDPTVKHLLVAQAHMPPTELPEMAGFGRELAETLTAMNLAAAAKPMVEGQASAQDADVASLMAVFSNRQPFSNQAKLVQSFGNDAAVPCKKEESQFRHRHGQEIPVHDAAHSIRQLVIDDVNKVPEYVNLFAAIFDDVKKSGKVEFIHVAQALAEFEMKLTFANAPIDEYARGDRTAMTDAQKRGAVLFFRDNSCVSCHAVSGKSNEMFSDFQNRRIGVPQIAPIYRDGYGNFMFEQSDVIVGQCDQDPGVMLTNGDPESAYKFRTSPLRNVGAQPTFFHNGAYTRLEDAIKHHTDVVTSVKNYDAKKAGVADDLTILKPSNNGPLRNLDPMLQGVSKLSAQDIADLTEFVGVGLMDDRARMDSLCKLVPKKLPSGRFPGIYEGCP